MKSRIVQFANDRPTSLDDDLYQWAVDAEIMLRRIDKENESLKDWIREEGYRSNTCTWNILREKCSYCQCNKKQEVENADK